MQSPKKKIRMKVSGTLELSQHLKMKRKNNQIKKRVSATFQKKRWNSQRKRKLRNLWMTTTKIILKSKMMIKMKTAARKTRMKGLVTFLKRRKQIHKIKKILAISRLKIRVRKVSKRKVMKTKMALVVSGTFLKMRHIQRKMRIKSRIKRMTLVILMKNLRKHK